MRGRTRRRDRPGPSLGSSAGASGRRQGRKGGHASRLQLASRGLRLRGEAAPRRDPRRGELQQKANVEEYVNCVPDWHTRCPRGRARRGQTLRAHGSQALHLDLCAAAIYYNVAPSAGGDGAGRDAAGKRTSDAGGRRPAGPGVCSPAAAAEPKVVVTIKPLHALVAQVMAGVGVPELLVKGSASPHTYALRPSETRALQRRRPVRAHVRDGGAVHGQDRAIAAR